LGKTIALRFEIIRFLKKPALYALKLLNFKLTLPSLDYVEEQKEESIMLKSRKSRKRRRRKHIV
jgi:hypothetical protein